MKRSLSWLFAALLFISCGGGDSGTGPGGGNNTPPTPQPTAVGSPDGNATSQTIGAAGGSVMSEDSTLTVTIPAGALASDTLITVAPITNTAWGGIGKGFRLTPQGLHFNVPVSLSFKVAPEDLAETAPDFLDIAVQDDQGFWYILKNASYDSGSQAMTATTSHFSDYSTIEGLQIRPPSATVVPMGTVTLTVKYCVIETISSGDDNLVGFLYSCSEDDDIAPTGTFTNWSVNGVKGGNNQIGKVVALNGTHARYTAPAAQPLSNPAVVSVRAKGRRGSVQLLLSNISVKSDFVGNITHVTGTGAPGKKEVWHMHWTSGGAQQGSEFFFGEGTLDYTPPDCETVAPLNAAVTTAYMIVDRTHSPFQVTLAVEAAWGAHICSACGGSTNCVDDTYVTGFQDNETGTLSTDGNTITGYFLDLTNDESWNYQFTRGAPGP